MWSAPVTTEAADTEPLLLSATKEFLRIDVEDTTFDAELTAAIAGVRDDVESITGTRLITQTVKLKADCFADLLRLPIGPVQSITGLAYVDAAGADQALTAGEDFELFGAGLEQGLRPVFGGTWPAGAIRARSSSIAVTAVVGYGAAGGTLPPALYATLLRAVRAQFDGKTLDLTALVANYRLWL